MPELELIIRHALVILGWIHVIVKEKKKIRHESIAKKWNQKLCFVKVSKCT